MGKIVKLKNKKTGEYTYPVTVTKAVADADSGERLNDILSQKVEEAPKDDQQYARINGAWALVDGGGDETALITLLPNSDELNGATVNVTTSDGDVLLNTTWNGSIISIQIPAGTDYIVSVGDMFGYITPSSKTFTATKGAFRSIDMVYVESSLKVTFTTDQQDDSAITGIKAVVKYDSNTVEVDNGEVISLPLNVNVVITFPDVDAYKKPNDITFEHTGGGVEKTGTYFYHGGTIFPENGVYIQDTDGFCFTSSEWTGSYTPNGVAVVTENCSFVIALSVAETSCRWGKSGDYTGARSEYDGVSNTALILQNTTIGDMYGTAGSNCNSYTFPNGKNGYLGAKGEWQAVVDNITAINELITQATQNSAYAVSTVHGHWTSTEYNSDYAYYVVIDGEDPIIPKSKDTNPSLARAFQTLK